MFIIITETSQEYDTKQDACEYRESVHDWGGGQC